MKITHIIIGLNVGGAELMLKRLVVSHMRHPEYEHSVISLTGIGEIGLELQSMGVQVTALGMKSAVSALAVFWRLRRELSSSTPDIVQTWMYHADLIGGLAARTVGIRRVVWGVRTTEIKEGGARLTRFIRKLCAMLSPYIPVKIVCAAHAARRVHENIGYIASKMLVIPNGFVIENLKANPEQIEAIRQELGLADNQRVLGSMGRFNSVKDQRNFVHAAGILSKTHLNLKFLMVGRGLEQNNVQLRCWIAETGEAERFILLGERLDVPACLAVMDVFCLHSRTEGFPNVVGEAMAMAKPCVVTNVGDAAILVGDTGIVVPKGNPMALAEGIERLLSLPPLELRKLGLAAQRRIYENFTMDQARIEFEKLYQDLYSN